MTEYIFLFITSQHRKRWGIFCRIDAVTKCWGPPQKKTGLPDGMTFPCHLCQCIFYLLHLHQLLHELTLSKQSRNVWTSPTHHFSHSNESRPSPTITIPNVNDIYWRQQAHLQNVCPHIRVYVVSSEQYCSPWLMLVYKWYAFPRIKKWLK